MPETTFEQAIATITNTVEKDSQRPELCEAVFALTRDCSDETLSKLVLFMDRREKETKSLINGMLRAGANEVSDLIYKLWVKTRKPFLTSAITENGLKPDFHHYLKVFNALDSGSIKPLAQCSAEAVQPLVDAVLLSGDSAIENSAMDVLKNLRNQDAQNELIRIWADTRDPILRDIIINRAYIADHPPRLVVLSSILNSQPYPITHRAPELASALIDACSDWDQEIASKALDMALNIKSQGIIDELCSMWVNTRDQLLARLIKECGYTAREPGKVLVLSCLKAGKESEIFENLPECAFPLAEALQDRDREIASKAAKTLLTHKLEPIIGKALCEMALEKGSQVAADLALKLGHCPDNPVQRALFLFLSQQWSEYEQFDFDMSLLRRAYETAGDHLRSRLAKMAAKSGRLELIEIIASARHKRTMDEMTEGEWETALSILERRREWEKMWKLAKDAPGVWAVKAMSSLVASKWRPDNDFQMDSFLKLAHLAEDCVDEPPVIGMVEKPINKFKAHGRRVTSLIVNSFFHRSIATSSWDRKISLWNMKDGAKIRDFQDHRDPVTSLVASGNGELIYSACAADRNIYVWRGQDGKLEQMIPGHIQGVASLALSRDSETLAAGGHDKTCRVWRLADLTLIAHLKGHWGAVTSAAFSPDQDLLVTGSEDGYLRTWDVGLARLLNIFQAHNGTVKAITFTADSRWIISSGLDGNIVVWDTRVGNIIHTITGNGSVVSTLRLSGDNRILAAGCHDGAIRLWILPDFKPWGELREHEGPVTCLATDPESRTLVSGGHDCMVAIWNFQSGILRRPTTRIDMEKLESISRSSLKDTEKKWMDFVMAQMRIRWQFDVEIHSGPDEINIGEFDIEILS